MGRAWIIAGAILAQVTALGADKPKQHLPHLVESPVLEVAPESAIHVKLSLDAGWKLNHAAPSYLKLFDGDTERESFGRKALEKGKITLPTLTAGRTYRLQGTIYFCEAKKESVCIIQSLDQLLKATGSIREIKIGLHAPGSG